MVYGGKGQGFMFNYVDNGFVDVDSMRHWRCLKAMVIYYVKML